MTPAIDRRRKPQIIVSRSDHEKLVLLAETFATRNPVEAEELLEELDRAKLVPDTRVPDGVIRMGSALRYSTDSGAARGVTLVYPAEADIAAGRVSIMTPIGVALIGLSAGQSIDWKARDGRSHRLTIESVEALVDAGQELA